MRKIKIVLVVVILVMMLSGCKEEKVNESYYIISDQVQIPETIEPEEVTLVADKTILKLYYPDETKQFILSKMIEVNEINKNTIMEYIWELGYVDETIKLFQLSGQEVEGVGEFIKAEFSSGLKNEIESASVEEGQIIYACIVNTLLNAYDAVGVSVFAGNELLEFPETENNLAMEGADLPNGYYSYFALAHENQIESDFTFDGITKNIKYTRYFCEEGYRMYYEEEDYVSSFQEEESQTVFEKKDGNVSIYIYLSDSSKSDTMEKILLNKEIGRQETIENLELKLGVEAYNATGILKKSETEINNYYIIEKEGQVFVIETKFSQEATLEDQSRVDSMLATFQLIK